MELLCSFVFGLVASFKITKVEIIGTGVSVSEFGYLDASACEQGW